MFEMTNFCSNVSGVLWLVGWVLMIFKVVIPLIIIALGIFDLGKAAVSSKPEEIKKSATSLVWRGVGGIVIFFIPAIVLAVFEFIGGFRSATNAMGNDYEICKACINTPWSSNCPSDGTE